MSDFDTMMMQYGVPRKAEGDKFLFDLIGPEEYYGPPAPRDQNSDLVEPHKAAPRAVLTQGYDRVLPSHDFWDRYVSTSPDVHDRIGRLQAAGMAAANGLGFGLPMAVTRRLAPEAARRAQAVMDAYPTEKHVAGIGSAVANPANIGLRAAGNALASKGYGTGAQAVADGLTALGVSAIPEAIEGKLSRHSDIPAATAMAARVMMPTLPASIIERALRGAQAGAVTQLPAAAMLGDFDRIPVGATYGAIHGTALRRSPREPDIDQYTQRLMREDYFNRLAQVGGLYGGPVMMKGAMDIAKSKPEGEDRSNLDEMLSQYGMTGKP